MTLSTFSLIVPFTSIRTLYRVLLVVLLQLVAFATIITFYYF